MRGLAWLDSDTRAMLDPSRWRQMPLGRRGVALALVIVLLLHGLFTLVIWREMQPKAQRVEIVHMELDQALQLRLLEPPVARSPSAPPPPALPAPKAPAVAQATRTRTRTRPAVREPARPDAMAVQDHNSAPAAASSAAPAAPTLYAKDGSLLLPPTPTPAPAPPKPEVKNPPSDDSQIMRHDKNLAHYQATRFDKYFPPPNETAGGAAGRHVGNAIQAVVKSVCNPKGGVVTSMLCGSPPIPPSPKDGDERLNMAPAASLAQDPHPPKPPAIETCIAEYRATKPLSYGCPMDTPDRAFKAELSECINLYRAGKRLKTWCPVDTPKRAAAAASSGTDTH